MDNNNLAQQVGLRHIGIIMDGNGRCAKQRSLPRTAGHVQGAKTFQNCIDWCIELGVPCVTFYAFSTENWSRPKAEVDSIMRLFDKYLDKVKKLDSKNMKLSFIGDREPLSESIKQKMADCERGSAANTGLRCNIALNYGGRAEILNSVKKIAKAYKCGEFNLDELDEKKFSDWLYTGDLPDVDMIIRPSGEQRTSNFLIWQAAYAELLFMDVLWPDFTKNDLAFALREFGKRNRRFGGV